jgi:hypothetical protein
MKQLFAVCIDNTDYEASLIPRKIYEVIPDEKAAKDDLIRIVDESGEDYLYHVSHFVLVEFPAEVERILAAATPTMSIGHSMPMTANYHPWSEAQPQP